ncbi:MAG: PilZ domain-containing protein [Byssovorax sp.]
MSPPGGDQDNPRARRVKGARYSVSLRIRFTRGEREITAWALNASRGGLRAVFDEEHIDAGAELVLRIAEDPTERKAKIVWAQHEPDGTIAGIELDEPVTEATLAAWHVGPAAGSEPPPPNDPGRTSIDPALLSLPDPDAERSSS